MAERRWQRLGPIALSSGITIAVVFGFVAALGLLPGASGRGHLGVLPPENPNAPSAPVIAGDSAAAASGGVVRIERTGGRRAAPGQRAGVVAITARTAPSGTGRDADTSPGGSSADRPTATGASSGSTGGHDTGHAWPERGAWGAPVGRAGETSVALPSPINISPFNLTDSNLFGPNNLWQGVVELLAAQCGGAPTCAEVEMRLVQREGPDEEQADPENPERCEVRQYLLDSGTLVVEVLEPCEEQDRTTYIEQRKGEAGFDPELVPTVPSTTSPRSPLRETEGEAADQVTAISHVAPGAALIVSDVPVGTPPNPVEPGTEVGVAPPVGPGPLVPDPAAPLPAPVPPVSDPAAVPPAPGAPAPLPPPPGGVPPPDPNAGSPLPGTAVSGPPPGGTPPPSDSTSGPNPGRAVRPEEPAPPPTREATRETTPDEPPDSAPPRRPVDREEPPEPREEPADPPDEPTAEPEPNPVDEPEDEPEDEPADQPEENDPPAEEE